jgi:hypothetical protein
MPKRGSNWNLGQGPASTRGHCLNEFVIGQVCPDHAANLCETLPRIIGPHADANALWLHRPAKATKLYRDKPVGMTTSPRPGKGDTHLLQQCLPAAE